MMQPKEQVTRVRQCLCTGLRRLSEPSRQPKGNAVIKPDYLRIDNPRVMATSKSGSADKFCPVFLAREERLLPDDMRRF